MIRTVIYCVGKCITRSAGQGIVTYITNHYRIPYGGTSILQSGEDLKSTFPTRIPLHGGYNQTISEKRRVGEVHCAKELNVTVDNT